MPVIRDPVRKAVRPINSIAGVAHARHRRRHAWRRGRWAILVRLFAVEGKYAIIVGVVWRGMVEDGFLRGSPGVGRIQERRDRLCKRVIFHGVRAARAEEESAQEEGDEEVLVRAGHDALKSNEIYAYIHAKLNSPSPKRIGDSRRGCGLRGGNRTKRGKNRLRVCEALVRLILKRHLKAGEYYFIASNICDEFFHTVFIGNTDIVKQIVQIQNVMFNG